MVNNYGAQLVIDQDGLRLVAVGQRVQECLNVIDLGLLLDVYTIR
jgi:hypothetical protein